MNFARWPDGKREREREKKRQIRDPVSEKILLSDDDGNISNFQSDFADAWNLHSCKLFVNDWNVDGTKITGVQFLKALIFVYFSIDIYI